MDKTKIKTFFAKVHKSGNSHVITIPSYLIRAEIVALNKEYKVCLE